MSSTVKILLVVFGIVALGCCILSIFFFRFIGNFMEENLAGVRDLGDSIVERTFTEYDPQIILGQMDPNSVQNHDDIREMVENAQATLGVLISLDSFSLPPTTTPEGDLQMLYTATCEFENGVANVEIVFRREGLGGVIAIDRFRLEPVSFTTDDDDDELPEEHGMG